MARKAVVDKVNTVLAGWSGAPKYGPNLQYDTPADGSAYVLVEYPLSNSDIVSFGSPGNNLVRDEGTIRLIIHAVRGSEVDTGLTWAEELSALFLGIDDGDGFRTYAPSPPTMDDNNEEGMYYLLSVAIPYEYDHFG